MLYTVTLRPGETRTFGWVSALAGPRPALPATASVEAALDTGSGPRRRRLAREAGPVRPDHAARGPADRGHDEDLAGAHADVASGAGAAARHAQLQPLLDPRRGHDGRGAEPAGPRRSVARTICAGTRPMSSPTARSRAASTPRRRSGAGERQPRRVRLPRRRDLPLHRRPDPAARRLAPGAGRDRLHGRAARLDAHRGATARRRRGICTACCRRRSATRAIRTAGLLLLGRFLGPARLSRRRRASPGAGRDRGRRTVRGGARGVRGRRHRLHHRHGRSITASTGSRARPTGAISTPPRRPSACRRAGCRPSCRRAC